MDREVEEGAPRLLKTVRPDPGRSSRDIGLSRMIGLSAVLHVVIIIALVLGVAYGRDGPAPPVAYMVELVGPGALGAGFSSAGRLKVAAAPPKRTPKPEPTAGVTSEPRPSDEASKPTETPPLHRMSAPVKPAVEPRAVPKPPSPVAETKLATKKPKEPKAPVARTPARPQRAKKKQAAPIPEKKELTKKAPKPSPKKAARLSTIKDDDTRIVAAMDRIRTSVATGKPPSVGSTGPTPSSLGRAGKAGGGAVRGLVFMMYTQDVRERVRDSWVVTERKRGLIAKVRFGVRPDGKVFNVELTQRSGDSVFDQSVLRAVLRAGPLPPPPPKYAHAFAEELVEITFGGDQ